MGRCEGAAGRPRMLRDHEYTNGPVRVWLIRVFVAPIRGWPVCRLPQGLSEDEAAAMEGVR
jgi:hypothetical protein